MIWTSDKKQDAGENEAMALLDLPPELEQYLATSDQSVAHPLRAQNVGRLNLILAPRPRKTCLVSRSQAGPIYLLQPIYTDPLYSEQVFLYTIQSGDGMVQGDRYFLNFTCEADSAVHITSQSATKIFRMEEDLAYQRVNLRIEDGAFVEYLPDPVIPFRDSRCYQSLSLNIAPTATLILGEILLPGRVASGERHQYTFYGADIQASRPDGRLLFADRVHLAPRQAPPHSLGRLGAYEVLATLFILTSRLPARELTDRLRPCLAAHAEVLAGVSELPNGCGVSVRMLGHTSLAIKSAFHRAWNEARLALIGLPAPDLRKC